MNEKGTNIGDIFGRTMGGVIGATAPMMTGLIKSMLTPERVKSMVGMLPKILGAVIDAISSIDMGELLSSIDGGDPSVDDEAIGSALGYARSDDRGASG